jgi:hypothetical protein
MTESSKRAKLRSYAVHFVLRTEQQQHDRWPAPPVSMNQSFTPGSTACAPNFAWSSNGAIIPCC